MTVLQEMNNVRILTADLEPAWDNYIQSHTETTIFHHLGWKRAVERAYGLKSSYLLTLDSEGQNSRVTGVLPLFNFVSLSLKKSLISVPYGSYGSICADDPKTELALIDAAKTLLTEKKMHYLELRSFARPLEADLVLKTQPYTFILDLPGSADDLWKSFSPKVRNQVRKGTKSNLTFRSGKQYLPDFYPVYAAHMRDLGTPVHSRIFFEAIVHEFGENLDVFVVFIDQKPIGGMIAVCFKGTMLDLWACSLRQYFEYCPNNLLYWEVLKNACERGFKRFDFGRSSPNSGTVQFKKQWGAEIRPLFYYRWVKSSKPLSQPPDNGNKSQKMLTTAWSHLPICFANLVGPIIRKYIP